MLEIIWMESQYKPLWFSRMYNSIPGLDSSLGSRNFDH
jgi:hypothetical protein